MLEKTAAINSWQHAKLALGVSMCLVGALVMVVGESIFGQNHTGTATVIGMVGISLIARSSKGW